MKILLLGKNGQVGRALQQSLLGVGGELVALAREELDLANTVVLRRALNFYAPEVIVNAAAYTAVDKAETEETLAYQINAKAVAELSTYASETGALLVQYSTDYVFDGEKASPYLETDLTRPLNAYGRTKRAGEEAIFKSGCNSLVLRTSWVYSAYGHNFVKTILQLAKERDTLKVVADQIGAPTSANRIADLTAFILKNYAKGHNFGLYHLAAAGKTSWYGFACQVVKRALANGIALKLSPENIHAVPTEGYPLPAKRPKNACLNTTAFIQKFGYDFPDWRSDVDAVVDELTCARLTR